MKYAIALAMIIISGCSIVRIDTLKNCSMEGESFMNWVYWKLVDCTDEEDERRDSPTKAEKVLTRSE